MRSLLLVVALLVLLGLCGRAVAQSDLLAGLDTDDPKALAEAVAAIERAPTSPGLGDVLFAAARACEDRLYDPGRALALYERIARELPDAGVSIAASRRAAMLRGSREYAREASQLAQLIALADLLPPGEVERRADALANIAWPGAIDAQLFVADWLCRTQRFGDSQSRYTRLLASASTSEQARIARRNAAGCAIDAKDWRRAAELAATLTGDEIDEAIRADLFDSIATGKRRAWLYSGAWIASVIAAVLLLVSFAEAVARGGLRAPPWLPPVEVMFLAPLTLVVVVASYAIDQLIAPAVVRISVAGVVTAWLSGATLDLLRRRGRPVRLRAIVHVVNCALLVVSVGYIAITRGGLLDMLSETVRFGPGG